MFSQNKSRYKKNLTITIPLNPYDGAIKHLPENKEKNNGKLVGVYDTSKSDGMMGKAGIEDVSSLVRSDRPSSKITAELVKELMADVASDESIIDSLQDKPTLTFVKELIAEIDLESNRRSLEGAAGSPMAPIAKNKTGFFPSLCCIALGADSPTPVKEGAKPALKKK